MDSKKVVVRATATHGKDVFARVTIKKDEVIAAFDGKMRVWIAALPEDRRRV